MCRCLLVKRSGVTRSSASDDEHKMFYRVFYRPTGNGGLRRPTRQHGRWEKVLLRNTAAHTD